MNRSIFRKTGLLGAALLFFTVSLLLEHVSFYSLNEKGRIRRFEKTFQEKELHLYSLFEEIEQVPGGEGANYFNILQTLVQEGIEGWGLDIYILKGADLVFW